MSHTFFFGCTGSEACSESVSISLAGTDKLRPEDHPDAVDELRPRGARGMETRLSAMASAISMSLLRRILGGASDMESSESEAG